LALLSCLITELTQKGSEMIELELAVVVGCPGVSSAVAVDWLHLAASAGGSC